MDKKVTVKVSMIIEVKMADVWTDKHSVGQISQQAAECALREVNRALEECKAVTVVTATGATTTIAVTE